MGRKGRVNTSGAVAFAILSLAACCLVAIASYTCVEKPVTRFLNRRWRSAVSQHPVVPKPAAATAEGHSVALSEAARRDT